MDHEDDRPRSIIVSPDAAAAESAPLASRREFLRRTGLLLAGLAIAGPAVAQRGLLTLLPLGKGLVDVGPVASFKPGTVTDETSAAAVMVSHTADGLIALSPVCTHEGCLTRWFASEKAFLCPCHGAAYGPDGAVLARPARAPLAMSPVQVKNGRVLVNTDKLLPRSSVQKSDFVKV